MNRITEVLASARERIKKPQHWVREKVAEDGKGWPVAFYQKEAEAWCAVGSVNCSAFQLEGLSVEEQDALADQAVILLNKACSELSNGRVQYITSLNDMGGGHEFVHAYVIKIFDRALELARKGVSNAADDMDNRPLQSDRDPVCRTTTTVSDSGNS